MYRLLKRVAAVAVLSLSFVHPSWAAPIVFLADLDGLSESPPNGSPGTGFARITFDDVADTMRVEATFSGLLGTTLAAHIHCCTTIPFAGTAGVATTTPTFPGFPGGVTSGTYDQLFDMSLASSYNPAFVTAQGSVAAAEGALLAGLIAGNTYFNIHTTNKPPGEIRGFLEPVPEPGTPLLLSLGLVGLGFVRQIRRT